MVNNKKDKTLNISIEYCQEWNYKPRASSLEAELKQELGQKLDVELIAGSGGVFEVMVNNRLVFSKKKQGRFPDIGELVKLLSWDVT